MPRYFPDLSQPATLRTTTLQRGSALWRVHSDTYTAVGFNPTVRSVVESGGRKLGGRGSRWLVSGGRFDATSADSYQYLYAGSDTVAVAAETLFRDRPPISRPYIVPSRKLMGLKLSKLEVVKNLKVAKLYGEGLSAIGQDAWLSACGQSEYPVTREWAMAIRHWDEKVCGLEWHPRNDNSRFAFVFFSDRCPFSSSFDVFKVERSYSVDRPGRGFSLMQQAAIKHNAVLNLP